MRPLNKGFLYTTCCALALSLPGDILAQDPEAAPRESGVIAASELPDSPGAAWSKAQGAFGNGNMDEAVSAAKDVKAKLDALADNLKMNLPAPAATPAT